MGCIDSRAPAEIIFDLGIGDAFSARVSGSFVPDRASGNPASVQAVAVKNVELTMARILERSSILSARVESGEIGLAGALYDIHSGRVIVM